MQLNKKRFSKVPSVGKNAIYQTIYQVLATLTPLITSPHISRELQAAKLGEFTYSYSIVSYFMLVALLGIVNYGTRTIAEQESDKKSISNSFWNLYCMQLLTTITAIIFYAIYIMCIPAAEQLLAILQGIWLLGAMTDVSWFYFGIEEFKVTVSTNIFMKIVTVLSIIIFVRAEASPLITYTFIMAFGHLLSSLILFLPLRKYVIWLKPSFREIKKHFYPNLKLFIPLLAGSVFHTMDKTMLGKIASYEELGYYYNADKLINIPLGVINGFGTVFLPRASKIFSLQKNNDGIHFLNRTFEVNTIVTCLLAFGIAGCAREFIPIFFGPGYEACIELTYWFIPVLIVKAIAIFFRMQYLVPKHKDFAYSIATIFGAITNVIANIILIRVYGAKGAVIGTLIAETVVLIVQFLFNDRDIPIYKWIEINFKYMFFGVIMLIAMRYVVHFAGTSIIQLISEIAVGGFLYVAMCAIDWVIKNLMEKRRSL